MRYYDYAATTPTLPQVLEAMRPFQEGAFGNPSSVYGIGRDAKKGLEEAREKVADAIGALPSEIIFTGGGTEADNMALKGAAFAAAPGSRIITCTTEHHAVLHAAGWLSRMGYDVVFLPVDSEGIVELSALSDALTPNTAIVSVMLANNEVGTIQPLKELVDVVRAKSKALIHTDAVQALGKIPVDVGEQDVDLASFSAHKVGGPKGVGSLFIRRKTKIEPLIHGGGQERDIRSGTPNVSGIAGWGEAAKIAAEEVDEESKRLSDMRDRLQDRLTDALPGIRLNGSKAPRVPGTLNVCIPGVEGESLLLMLDSEGIAASSGSACTSGSLEPSHVLAAMGVDKKTALGSLRISLGRGSTEEDIDHLLDVLPGIVGKLRPLSAMRS